MKKQIGVVGVDAGLLWLGDPCYIMGEDASEHPVKTWKEFCDKLDEKGRYADGLDSNYQQWNYKLGHAGLGVTVSTGNGDGEYPVFAEFDKDGRVKSVTVKF